MLYLGMHAIASNEKEVMDLKKSRDIWEGLEGRKGREKGCN